MKKAIAVLMTIVLLLTALTPTPAFAATSYYDVTRDNAPIRSEPYETASVIMECPYGMMLEVSGWTVNRYLNKWMEVNVDGRVCYIYSGNVDRHSHVYQTVHFNDETYRFCKCGTIERTAGGPKLSGAALTAGTALVRFVNSPAYYGAASAATLADGPFPVGDVIALGMTVIGTCVSAHMAMPTIESIVELVTDEEFNAYLRNRDRNICTPYSFRKVQRLNGALRYIDEYCMDEIEAMIYVRALKGDVYTSSEDAAMMLVAKYGAGVCERDKDAVSYYFHYHLTHGNAQKRYGGHVFFGTNDLGQVPY